MLVKLLTYFYYFFSISLKSTLTKTWHSYHQSNCYYDLTSSESDSFIQVAYIRKNSTLRGDDTPSADIKDLGLLHPVECNIIKNGLEPINLSLQHAIIGILSSNTKLGPRRRSRYTSIVVLKLPVALFAWS